ncbi:MAG: 16S rRNA (guanine(966)-N(2))-methyltransferase RsmD [Proteobacteria bacterium]|nr:16S rRNA (guanine(966)-N(2))-methyltransferase RsmD [Pseudomonadota bacterium]
MRIVAGQAKGRKLLVPKGSDVRPTADRVREALFSSLGSRILNVRVLDLFAGTGALGLEALSRGAASAVFVEKNASVRVVLERNIVELGFESKTRVVPQDALSALRVLEKKVETFDIIFLDPPYRGKLLTTALSAIGISKLLVRGTIIVAEHPSGCEPSLPKSLRIVATRSYGGTDLSTIEQLGKSMPMIKEKD